VDNENVDFVYKTDEELDLKKSNVARKLKGKRRSSIKLIEESNLSGTKHFISKN
jgi:hypothetical protein